MLSSPAQPDPAIPGPPSFSDATYAILEKLRTFHYDFNDFCNDPNVSAREHVEAARNPEVVLAITNIRHLQDLTAPINKRRRDSRALESLNTKLDSEDPVESRRAAQSILRHSAACDTNAARLDIAKAHITSRERISRDRLAAGATRSTSRSASQPVPQSTAVPPPAAVPEDSPPPQSPPAQRGTPTTLTISAGRSGCSSCPSSSPPNTATHTLAQIIQDESLDPLFTQPDTILPFSPVHPAMPPSADHDHDLVLLSALTLLQRCSEADISHFLPWYSAFEGFTLKKRRELSGRSIPDFIHYHFKPLFNFSEINIIRHTDRNTPPDPLCVTYTLELPNPRGVIVYKGSTDIGDTFNPYWRFPVRLLPFKPGDPDPEHPRLRFIMSVLRQPWFRPTDSLRLWDYNVFRHHLMSWPEGKAPPDYQEPEPTTDDLGRPLW